MVGNCTIHQKCVIVDNLTGQNAEGAVVRGVPKSFAIVTGKQP